MTAKFRLTWSFTPKRIRWLRVEITGVSATTQNVGLSEIGVFQ